MEASTRYTEAEVQALEGRELTQLALRLTLAVGKAETDEELRPRVLRRLKENGLLMQLNAPSDNKPPAEVQQRHQAWAVNYIASARGDIAGGQPMSVQTLAQEVANWEREGHARAGAIIESLERRNAELSLSGENLNRQLQELRVENEKLRALTHAASKHAKEAVARAMQHGWAEAIADVTGLNMLVCGDCGEKVGDHVVVLNEGCKLECRRNL